MSEGRKAKALVVAPELSPKPLTKAFVAAVLRRQSECLADVIRRERYEAREEGAKSGAGDLAARLERAETKHDEMEARVREFEDKSGVHLDKWNLGNVAEAVKRLSDPTYRTQALDGLKREAELYKRQLKNVKEEIAALEAVPSLMDAEPSRDEDEGDDREDHRDVAVG